MLYVPNVYCFSSNKKHKCENLVAVFNHGLQLSQMSYFHQQTVLLVKTPSPWLSIVTTSSNLCLILELIIDFT